MFKIISSVKKIKILKIVSVDAEKTFDKIKPFMSSRKIFQYRKREELL